MAFPDSFHHWHNFAFLNRGCRRRFFAFIVTSLVSYTLTFINFILGLPSLGSLVAFSAYTIRSSPISALYFLQYAIRSLTPLPLFHNYLITEIPSTSSTRIDSYEDHFASKCSTLSVLNSQTLNCVPAAVQAVLTYSLGFWVISVRKWSAESIKLIEMKRSPTSSTTESFLE